MQLLRSLNEFPDSLRGGAVSIGNFDGVHLGHARIIERLREMAAGVGGPSIVFTFDPHPVRLLRPDKAPPPLTWTDRKAELLAELGVDAVVAYPTDDRLLALTAEQFFTQIVRESLSATGMVEGPNFFFGRDRAGNITLLAQLCAAAGMQLQIIEPLKVGDDYISSSRIRALIAAGDVDQARSLLTHPYRIRGMVTHGAARGTKIGFPTANVDAVDTLLPAHGVYAGRAYVVDEQWRRVPRLLRRSRGGVCHTAAINIGPAPTFGENAAKVEAHLIGFRGSLYGEPIEVEFLSRLRGVQAFASIDELTSQLAIDVTAAIGIAGTSIDANPH